MNILRAQVITGRGADKIVLTTDLPSPFTMYDDFLTLEFQATIGTGVNYVRHYFGIEPEVIDIP